MFSSNGTQVSGAANYIEDVFSTYLYTGNSSTQTITNGIDLSTYGGLVWLKNRTADGSYTAANYVVDSARSSFRSYLITNSSNPADPETAGKGVTSVSTTGFVLGTSNISTNTSAVDYVSWTFREQSKFFDVVTYTGTGSNTTIAHNLGSVPGCIIVKCTSVGGFGYDWRVYHRSLTSAAYTIQLNTTSAEGSQPSIWNSTAPTSTVFSVGTDIGVNESGQTYVAYLFAHDAGGFGLTGTDNVISCGSYTGNGSATGPVVTLGYEPQWLMVKTSSAAGSNWQMLDNMRGMPVGSADATLQANLSANESSVEYASPTATGFQITSTSAEVNTSAGTYIYIAIRRGPMKVPTLGTSVFGLNARTGTGANATVTGGQTDDAVLIKNRGSAVASLFSSRLTGTGYLVTSDTAAEVAAGTTILQANPWDVMDGVKVGTTSTITNASANTYINYLFRRAPGFFDEVCYTGTGSATTVTHNLAAVPELMIAKSRVSALTSWFVYSSALGATKSLFLEQTSGPNTSTTFWNDTTPTSTVFSLGSGAGANASAGTFVAYLFATCAGVSKVGTYTGNGTTQTINCGFTGGARFVLIKRTDSTGDWYVYDTARGMTVLTDPYLLINSTAAETATLGSVTTVSTGFALDSAILAAINVNAGSYIFLAIA